MDTVDEYKTVYYNKYKPANDNLTMAMMDFNFISSSVTFPWKKTGKSMNMSGMFMVL